MTGMRAEDACAQVGTAPRPRASEQSADRCHNKSRISLPSANMRNLLCGNLNDPRLAGSTAYRAGCRAGTSVKFVRQMHGGDKC